MRFLRGFGGFWWDFIVGDDWRIAAGVVGVLTVGALATSGAWFSGSAIVVVVAIGIAAVAIGSIVLPARRAAGRSTAPAAGE
jgi:hypothetical protein